MVESSSTSLVDDTTSVGSEPVVFSLDSDGNWVLIKGNGKVVWVSWDISVSTNLNLAGVVWNSSASVSVSTIVWVRRGSDDTLVIVHEPLPGWSHKTTSATEAALFGSNTVNSLLLRKRNWGSIFLDGYFRFKRRHGSESPAGTASTLVLNWSNFTGLGPVDAISHGEHCIVTSDNWSIATLQSLVDVWMSN